MKTIEEIADAYCRENARQEGYDKELREDKEDVIFERI
jgi:hypothetical protein